MNMVSSFIHHVNLRNPYKNILILEKDMVHIMNKFKGQKCLWQAIADRMKKSPLFSEKRKVFWYFFLGVNMSVHDLLFLFSFS